MKDHEQWSSDAVVMQSAGADDVMTIKMLLVLERNGAYEEKGRGLVWFVERTPDLKQVYGIGPKSADLLMDAYGLLLGDRA